VQESAVRSVVVVCDDGDEVGVLVADAGVAVGALGATAVAPAHPAMSTERTVPAMSRIADIIAESEVARGKTSLKT
jgi:hypothetical protein